MQHLRYSNASTDGFVCSMHCQLCALHHGLAALDCLAANLATAAMLVRAFRLGDSRGLQAAWNRGLHGCTVDPHNMWCQNIEGRAAPTTTPVAARAGEE